MLKNNIIIFLHLDLFFVRYYYRYKNGRGEKDMNEKRSSVMLSFLIGGLIGGGITFLLTSSLMRKRNTVPARETGKRGLSDEMKEQSYEEGDYCAPEGASMRYDMGKDLYYSGDE